MTNMAAEPVFVDTGVLVHAGVGSAPRHRDALSAIQDLRRAGAELWISRQALRDYLAVLSRTRTFSQPIAAQALARQVHQFERWFRVADDTARVTSALLDLLPRFPAASQQIREANLVATMRAHGVTRLLTHQVEDFAPFSDIITVMPLPGAP